MFDGLYFGQFRKKQASISRNHHLFEALCVQTTTQMQNYPLCAAQVHARDDSGYLDLSRKVFRHRFVENDLPDGSPLKSHIDLL
jgi:hypothetical protein